MDVANGALVDVVVSLRGGGVGGIVGGGDGGGGTNGSMDGA